MNQDEALKQGVKDRYAKIATSETTTKSTGCCSTKNPNKIYHMMMDDYSATDGYVPDADLGLGCGLPTQFAQIQEGNTVIDLGSGAGNDCFVARHETGPEGKVIGIDFTPEMIEKARVNAEKLQLHNVEFRLGDIDDMPVNNEVADVVVSNCVLNLVPNKQKVLQEIHRVLKRGGHFSISDIVLVGELPEKLKQDATMYAGCVAGAIQKDAYLQLIADSGFKHITLQKEKPIELPDSLLAQYLDSEEIVRFKEGGLGIYSITVYGKKSRCGGKGKKAKEGGSCCCGGHNH